jgi:Asp-tRNA(Asn)/Glu-tRNA(Gln) amidotransferase A subunit family amidase
VGPITRTVRDAALVLGVISGFDARDPSSVAEPTPDFTAACEEPVKGMRIAWSPTLGYAEPTNEVVAITTEAVRAFEDLGCEVVHVDEIMEDPFDMWVAEFYAGVGTKLKEPLTRNSDIIDPTLVDMLASALDQTIDEYYRMVFARYEFREQMRKFFTDFDILLTPTLPVTAFDADLQQPPELPGKNIVDWIAYTYPMNLCGLPSASMPCGFTAGGLPVGLQLTGRVNRETDIFRAASAFEAARPWANNKPAMVN